MSIITLPRQPLVSMLLPNLDNEKILDLVLDRLATNTTYANYEVIAIDDGSTDGSREILRRWRDSGRFPRFDLTEKENSGVVETLNLALAKANGEVIVQLDADASVETPGWLEKMLGLLLSDDRVGIVGPKVVSDNGLLHACGIHVVDEWGMRDRPTTITEPVGYRRFHYRVERSPEGRGGAAEHEPAEVDAAIGCCLMYRRADALEVGGYDMGYSPVWFDDIDLCVAIRGLGRKVFYLPDVRVLHHVGARHWGTTRRQRYAPQRLRRAAQRRLAARLPTGLQRRIERRFDVDVDAFYTPPQRERVLRQYAYWRSKWGWDLVNPDMAEVQRRWGGTEICWATDPERREAGQQILRAYRSEAAPAAAAG